MNLLLTGTPGTGKSTIAKSLAEKSEFTHLDVSDIIVKEKLYDSYDEEYDTYVFDEDLLLKWLKPLIKKGQILLDTHQCGIFPSKWFDLVIVLKTDNTILYDRLKFRNYNDKKLEENIDCEIMEINTHEALETFGKDKILFLENKTHEDIEKNVDLILQNVKLRYLKT